MEGRTGCTPNATPKSVRRGISAAQLADLLRRFAALENVPMLNCEIYQDGTLSPLTVEVLKSAHQLR